MSAATAAPANAATAECGDNCISVFNAELGPSFVEGVLDGGTAQVGQPVGLAPVSGTDPTLDFIPGGANSKPAGVATVSDFFADGMVSAAANAAYGPFPAVQQLYSPFGVPTGLCVGVDQVKQGEDLILIPCDVPGRTVWIVYPTAQTGSDFAILNAATTNFDHPFGMYLPAQETARGGDELQMELRRLQFEDETDLLPGKQLWGVAPGFQG
ncbi:hypothetical protein ACWEOH_05785 [Agromyces sp. NPDC004153]